MLKKLQSYGFWTRNYIYALSDNRALLLACCLGILLAFALAPFYVLPILFISFTGMIWLLDRAHHKKRSIRHVFLLATAFSTGYLYFGIYWLAFSFFHMASGPLHLAALVAIGFVGVGILSIFIGLFYGAFVAGGMRLWSGHWSRILLFALTWSLAEYARGHLLTGFPWNLTGQAFAGLPILMQTVSVWGPYGLSIVVIAISCLPAIAIELDENTYRTQPFYALGLALLLLVGFGGMKLIAHPTEFHDEFKVQIVQPNVAQEDKINPRLYAENFMKAYDLTAGDEVGSLKPDEQLFVIWPENAAYTYFQNDETTRAMLDEILPLNATLITGTIRVSNGNYFNSVQVLENVQRKDGISDQQRTDLMSDDREWQITQSYDKHHLAPFGEYVPFYSLFVALGVDKIVPLNNGLTKGAGPSVVRVQNTSFAPVICYETIFPKKLYPKTQRPEWIVSVTNDAWFGDSVGPKQHMAQARMRAIESGLPLVRAANTGISALIDPYGRVLASLPLSENGALLSTLPKPAKATIYDKFGDFLYYMLIALMLAIVMVAQKKAYNQNN